MVRGEIYVADFRPRSGSEERGLRPCIVVSRDVFSSNPRWRSVSVVPLTSSARWLEPGPTTVVFEAEESGLSRRCAALAHQVTTMDKRKLRAPAVGTVSAAKMRRIEDALRVYLVL